MSSHLKAELAATCSTLGRLHKGEYLIEPECIESVKDLIRYLKRDNEAHEIRRYLGESKVLQNDLIHIIKSCSEESSDLFDVTLRLLINLTTPTMLFYGEEVPTEKIGRNLYLSLTGYLQEYKIAFCDVEFWNKICGKLTDLFETDWADRSADDGIRIERILMLLRNVVQVPADVESEKRPENDITVHDEVLWALRQSQILELLLMVSSNTNEEQYFLNLLEIFSLILREQNPKLLANCDIQLSSTERTKETEDLVRVRELEKKCRNKYLNMRNFNTSFVMKGVKSLSNNDVICHKSLEKVIEMDLNSLNKKQFRARRNRIPVESERAERRSAFSVRLFLKEFCLELLSSFSYMMSVVKSKLDSGRSLANDQTYYFWALRFFLDFATASNSDVNLIKNFLSAESFHFVQTSMDNAFEHLKVDKKKTVDWVKRIHLILKAYRSLLESLLWMDCSKNPLTRSISREIKSQIFYVAEYREMMLHVLLLYDPTKFSISYLRDLIETTHFFLKLLEDYSKETKLIVQKVIRKKSSKKKTKKLEEEVVESREERWEKIKDDVYDTLCSESTFPEIPPFDAALDTPIDDQKGIAMKNIQKFLHVGNIRVGIGLLRSARQVWPENDYFGSEGMSVEDEMMALQEICLADLGEIKGCEVEESTLPCEDEDDENEDLEDENPLQIVEQYFDIMDYKKRLVNKKVVEACGTLLKNYKVNSDHTNHCVIKLLHRIGWECCMPAMLFQASIFWTLFKIMKDKSRNYTEINTFTVNLLRRFRKYAMKNSVVFLELLFWKERNVALEIQHGYEPYEDKEKRSKRSKKKKLEQLDHEEGEKSGMRRSRRKKGLEMDECDMYLDELKGSKKGRSNKGKKTRKNKTNERDSWESNDADEEITTPNSVENLFNIPSDDSESDNDELSAVKKSNLRKTAHNEDESRIRQKYQVDGLDNREKIGEAIESEDEVVLSAKTNESARRKIIISSESEEEDNVGVLQINEKPPGCVKKQLKQRRDFTDRRGRKRENEKNSSNKLKPLDDSEDENENPAEVQNGSVVRSLKGDSNQGKDSDQSNHSQTSNSSYKKRAREGSLSYKNSSDGQNSKSKRLRCVGSDSDVGEFESEDETPAAVRERGKRKKRAGVIDSDSDVEANSLDEK